MSTSLTAPRATCLTCGRYVVTRRGKTAMPVARVHSAYHGPIGTIREWKQCSGSNQPVKVGS